MKQALVIGGGFAGMASAAKLSKQGMEVTLLERHDRLGGRGRSWEKNGYTFDMGPSWYLMPEVFEQFFEDLGKNREEYYSLKKLAPYYRVFFEGEGTVDIGPDRDGINKVFDDLEENGSEKLKKYLGKASYKYKVAIEEFLYREYRSIFQFINPRLVLQGSRLGVFGDLHSHVKKYFTDHRAQKILEYAMVFLGNSPSNAPALYSIMSHVDLVQGVYFPHGGMNKMVEGMHSLLEDLGVKIKLNTDVTGITYSNGMATGVETNTGNLPADVVLATGDYYQIEQKLLDQKVRNYSPKYWNKAVVAPSMFIMYLGVSKKLTGLKHHNLFFAKEWNNHFDEIFKHPEWPDNPSYYVSVTSDDDDSMSPEGKENVFVLVPVAPGLSADEQFRKQYGDKIIRHLENLCGEKFRDSIEVQRYYSGEEFTEDYGALKGTALGLAHTLGQTAVFRPSMRNKHLKNMFYAGQYTHPGVGVPMTLIAADIVSKAIGKEFNG